MTVGMRLRRVATKQATTVIGRLKTKEKSMSKIEIFKFDLKDGEELGQVVRALQDAVSRFRQRTDKSVFLSGIFNKFIITRDVESGKSFSVPFKRNSDGDIELGDPVEVRQVFVPVSNKQEKATGEPTLVAVAGEVISTKLPAETVLEVVKAICSDTAPTYEDAPESTTKSLWDGLL